MFFDEGFLLVFLIVLLSGFAAEPDRWFGAATQ